jgi:hypothetical protein
MIGTPDVDLEHLRGLLVSSSSLCRCVTFAGADPVAHDLWHANLTSGLMRAAYIERARRTAALAVKLVVLVSAS